MSSLVHYEPLVNGTIDAFIEQTKRRYSDTGKICFFSSWLQKFAFDVVGELTWSKRIGFVDRDEDVDGIVKFIGDFLAYASVVGQMPMIDLFLEKNPLKLQLQRLGCNNTVFPVTKFALDQNKGRAAEMEKIKQDGLVGDKSGKGVDLLTKFTQARKLYVPDLRFTSNKGRARSPRVHDGRTSPRLMYEYDLRWQ